MTKKKKKQIIKQKRKEKKLTKKCLQNHKKSAMKTDYINIHPIAECVVFVVHQQTTK